MTRTRDVACVDLTCTCSSSVSICVHICPCVCTFQLVDERQKRTREKKFLFHKEKSNQDKETKIGFHASG